MLYSKSQTHVLRSLEILSGTDCDEMKFEIVRVIKLKYHPVGTKRN